MATEEASVPREKLVVLTDGRKIKCCRIKTRTIIMISDVLRQHGVNLADLWVPTGRKRKVEKKDDGGKTVVSEEEIALPGKAIWSIPEVALTAVCASTGLPWDEVQELDLEDAAKLTGAVMDLVDLKGVAEALKNSFGLAQKIWASQMSG